MEDVIADGKLCSPEEVLNEVKKKEDGLHAFLNGQKEKVIVPLDEEVQDETREVLAEFPRLAGQMRGRNKADAFVVATAKAKEVIVVTEEGSRGNRNRPKIPLVCEHFGIECMNVLDYIEEQGWTFS